MTKPTKFMFLNLPNPPGSNILRGYAGGFGTAGKESNVTLLPIYLLYAVSAAEKAKCDFSVLDAQALGYNVSLVLNAVKKSSPDVVISWLSLPSLNSDLNALRQIKKVLPDILLVALGPVCNVMPEEILLNNSLVTVIQGSYPYFNLLSKLIDNLKANPNDRRALDHMDTLYVKTGSIIRNRNGSIAEDLDQLSLDAYRQLPVSKYLLKVPDAGGRMIEYIPLLTSAGCPHSCMYCPYPIGYGHEVLYKSVQRILEEIEFLNVGFNIKGFLFRDQAFTHDPVRALKICDELIKRKLNIKWFVECRVDEVSEPLLQKMKQAGCFRIHFGVETGMPELLRKVGKPGTNIEMIKKVFMLAKKYHIATTAHMIVGLPGEDIESIKESMNILREIKPDNANINIATPYPGTGLFKLAKEKGWITTFDWARYTSSNSILSTPQLSAPELENSAKKLKNKFRNFMLLSDGNYLKLHMRYIAGSMYSRIRK